MYLVKFTQDGLADVKALPKSIRNSLKRKIKDGLARDYGCSMELCEPLKGWRSFHWGKYRIVFRIYDELKTIAIAGIGERLPRSQSDIYRKLETLAREGKLAQKVLAALQEFSSSEKRR